MLADPVTVANNIVYCILVATGVVQGSAECWGVLGRCSAAPSVVDVSGSWDGARRGRIEAQAPRSYPAGVIRCKIQDRLLWKMQHESQLSEAECSPRLVSSEKSKIRMTADLWRCVSTHQNLEYTPY